MDKGGGGGRGVVNGLCVVAHLLGGSGGMLLQLNFRPFKITSGAFLDHLWFSNDMMR